jgi:hypothetical protein
MICKKCGREYDDDMPKCLWCSAPNEGPDNAPETETQTSDEQQSAFNQEEPENVVRGKSAILWTKIFIVLGVTVGLFSEYAFIVLKPYMEVAASKAAEQPPMAFGNAIAFLFYLFLLFVFCCVLLVAAFKACRWIYNTVKTLRKFTRTTFSPVAAAICTLIPVICGIFDYFIFKDILDRQKKTLALQKAKFVAPRPGMLKWILILSVIGVIPAIGYELVALRMISLAILVSAGVVYIKVMEAIIENENTLSIIRERELLERKVDEILTQRGNQ